MCDDCPLRPGYEAEVQDLEARKATITDAALKGWDAQATLRERRATDGESFGNADADYALMHAEDAIDKAATSTSRAAGLLLNAADGLIRQQYQQAQRDTAFCRLGSRCETPREDDSTS